MGSTDGQLRETDLYPPLKAWLEAHGYAVFAEVEGCDVVARRDDELVIVELKLAVNLDLLLQVVRRQQIAETVYAAVPPPKAADRRWRDLTRLLKRLEVGLLLVDPKGYRPVQVAFHPVKLERRRRAAATRPVIREISGRTLDCNIGGSTRTEIMTAYREQAVAVAAVLAEEGVAAPRQLRLRGLPIKTGSILLDNHYGWFKRLGRGKYTLTPQGRAALDKYGDVASAVMEKMKRGGEAASGKSA